jgi:hypothetical protein
MLIAFFRCVNVGYQCSSPDSFNCIPRQTVYENIHLHRLRVKVTSHRGDKGCGEDLRKVNTYTKCFTVT